MGTRRDDIEIRIAQFFAPANQPATHFVGAGLNPQNRVGAFTEGSELGARLFVEFVQHVADHEDVDGGVAFQLTIIGPTHLKTGK